MAIDHYENFPVASILLPRRLRAAVTNVYRYARTADDIADEGKALPEERLQKLAEYRSALQDIASGGQVSWPPPLQRVFSPLAATIREHALPLTPFLDLLSAFEQDVCKTRYRDDAELLDYCRRSANPVGRIMLHLYGAAQPDMFEQADAVCTGLQLTNFWQDVAIDWQKDRIYIPQDKLRAAGIDERYIREQVARKHPAKPDARWQALMRGQVAQARQCLLHGLPLTRRLPGRIAYELRLVVHGGLRILERLDELHYDMFAQRPTLRRRDWVRLLWRATTMPG